MTRKKFFIGGLILFLLFLGLDTVSHYFYKKSSSRQLEKCLENQEELKLSGNYCLSLQSAANEAYTSAVDNHLLTYFVFLCVFVILGSRFSVIEKRLEDLEKSGNF